MDLVVWEVSMDYVVRDNSDDSLVIQVLGVSVDVLLLFFCWTEWCECFVRLSGFECFIGLSGWCVSKELLF